MSVLLIQRNQNNESGILFVPSVKKEWDNGLEEQTIP